MPEQAEVPDLIIAWQQHQDHQARDRLIRMHDHIIRAQARRWGARYFIDPEDALQLAYIGWMRAIDRCGIGFEGAPSLSAFATHAVRNAIARGREDAVAPVHVPSYVIGAQQVTRRVAAQLRHQGITPTPEAIAEHSGLAPHHGAQATANTTIHLDAPVGGEAGSAPIGDFFASDDERPDETAERHSDLAGLRAALTEALDQMPPRRAEIVREWMALGCDTGAQTVVAEKLGIGRQAVSLAIGKAMADMRWLLEGDDRVEALLQQ